MAAIDPFTSAAITIRIDAEAADTHPFKSISCMQAKASGYCLADGANLAQAQLLVGTECLKV